jgi:subtilisin family serine protease
MDDITCKEMILSNDYADWLTDYELTEDLINQNTGTQDYCYRQIDNVLGLAFVKRDQLSPIGLLNYSYQHIPDIFGLQQEIMVSGGNTFNPAPLVSAGILPVQRPPLSLTGKGTIIAFIDAGIDYRNPVFRNQDGTSRILAIWDQTIQEGNPPENFAYGTEYTRQDINRALESSEPEIIVPTTDNNGHGTAMASIAAGSSIDGGSTFLGAAPGADILVVKLKECKPYLREYYLVPEDVPAYQSTDIIMAVEYADAFARAFYRPVIFCLGIGSSFGGHNGNSPLSSYLNRIGDKRSRVVVVAGGNEGNTANHYEGRLSPENNQGKNRMEDIEIRVGEGEKGFITEIWGRSPNVFSLSIRSPGGESIPNTGVRVGKGIEYQFIYEKTLITVNYALVEGATGDELITVRFQNPTPGIWTLTLQNDKGLLDAPFHLWLPISQFLSGETYFLSPNPNITLTEPSYGESTICVAAYSDKNNSIYVRSGRGFSRDSTIKPDIAAPAVDISVALKSIRGQLVVGTMTGSSMAAALTAGGAAQFMEWALTDKNANYLRSSEVKNYLIRGAVRDAALSYPNRQWGFGKLSIQGIFDSLAVL